MRVQHIRVTKLFGLFDHSVPVRLSDRVTIIHGPNGFGKTAMLQLLEAVLTTRFSTLRRIPFEEFSVRFEQGDEIIVRKLAPPATAGGEPAIPNVKLILKQEGKAEQEFTLDFKTSRARLGLPLEFIERRIEGLEQIGPETWLQLQTGRRLDLDDVVDTYAEMFPARVQSTRKLPAWLAEFSGRFDVRLIEAQRLITLSGERRSTRPGGSLSYEPAVASYSRELANRIQEKQAEYGSFAQKLDSTFPTRALQRGGDPHTETNALSSKIHELEERRQRIIAAGLITRDPEAPAILDPQLPIDDGTRGILSLYAEDVEQKLAVFDDITRKLELFKQLVNKRFTYKTLDFDTNSGFKLVSPHGLPLAPTDLSSGEQHELVLLYELLFKTQQNALILIDEPELSFHVAWQVEFLQDIRKVIDLSSFDVILATHSPQIINDRWDLTEELTGPAR
jgi:hypothetical protein